MVSDQNAQRLPVGDLGPNEPTRLCPDCRGVIHRCDEWAGCCPHCGRPLLSLVWRLASQLTGSSAEKESALELGVAERRCIEELMDA